MNTHTVEICDYGVDDWFLAGGEEYVTNLDELIDRYLTRLAELIEDETVNGLAIEVVRKPSGLGFGYIPGDDGPDTIRDLDWVVAGAVEQVQAESADWEVLIEDTEGA